MKVHLALNKVPGREFWFLLEEVSKGEYIEVACFTSGARAARFCNLFKLMGRDKAEVNMTVHLPQAILDAIHKEAGNE